MAIDASITGTPLGAITGSVTNADDGTINGTIGFVATGTISSTMGVPGPAGSPGATGPQGPIGPEGPPGEGGTWGSIVGDIENQTDLWSELGSKYPASNPSGYITASALSPYLTTATANATFQTLAGMSSYLTTSAAAAGYYPLSGNPSGFLTAASLSGYATESWVTGQGYITSAALSPYLLSSTAASTYYLQTNPAGYQTASQVSTALSPYLLSATAIATYQTLAGMSDYLSKAGNLSGLASTSTARTNLGLGSLAVVNDAPSDGSQYARKNGAWDVVTATSSYITSVSSPLSVTSGNLTIDLSTYAPLASPVFTGDPTAPTPTFGDNDTSIATTAFVQSALAGGTAVARNLEVEVRNQTGSTIPAGSIVYISGATGNKPLITLAQANNDTNSAQTIGFVKTSIANNGTGFVIVRGELENIDTSALTEGVQLYLSPTTAGTWTTTKPSAPQHLVYVGIVIRSHPTLGTILVAVQNGLELEELHDVLIVSPTNGQVLKYDSVSGLWKNGTDVGGVAWGGITGTLSSQTDLQSALDLKANLSGATFTGKVIVPASTTGSAFLNLPHGPLPTSPVNGDVWTTTADMRVRISGVSQVLATQSWVGSQGYTSTTFVVNEVNASKLKPQGTFSNSYEVPSSYNNYMLTLDTSEGTNKSVTFGALTVGSNVTFVQGGTDQIIFPSALAFQNKQASAGQNAVVTAHSTSGGWYLEGDLTYIPAGYVISSTCAYYSGQDAIGVTWDGYYYSEAVIANGSGGTYSTSTPNANGCWYPQGYCIQRGNNYNESTLSWEIYDSNMNMVANGTFAYSYQYDAEFANGDGTADWSYGITFNAYYGYLIANGQYYDSGYSQYYYYDVYSDGGSGYYVNTYQ